MDDQDRVFAPGMVVVRGARIEAVGEPGDVPEGFERVEYEGGWVIPGLVDLHSHVHGFDNHDYVYPVNPELRTTPGYRPGNPHLRRACASGVTTLFGIPGSGGNMSGAGILHKTKLGATFEEAIIASPGGLKIAQDSNPERRAYSIGSTRAGQGWLLTTINEKARRANERGERLPWLETLQRVQARELPVLIHTASSSGTLNTSRMWRETYETRSVLSHGSFNGWKSARYAARVGMPINNGPRLFDYVSSREGRFVAMAHEYHIAGTPVISLNTDAGVVAAGGAVPPGRDDHAATVATRYADVAAPITIHPAKVVRVSTIGSGVSRSGKHGDVVVHASGIRSIPRSRVEAGPGSRAGSRVRRRAATDSGSRSSRRQAMMHPLHSFLGLLPASSSGTDSGTARSEIVPMRRPDGHPRSAGLETVSPTERSSTR